MFKVGDKGKTRGGFDYTITNVHGRHVHCDELQPIEALLTGDKIHSGIREFCLDGDFNQNDNGSDFDLLPPEYHEEVEMPEYPCEDEYSLATLAGSAAQIARDHPDLIVQITPGSSAITIFAA